MVLFATKSAAYSLELDGEIPILDIFFSSIKPNFTESLRLVALMAFISFGSFTFLGLWPLGAGDKLLLFNIYDLGEANKFLLPWWTFILFSISFLCVI